MEHNVPCKSNIYIHIYVRKNISITVFNNLYRLVKLYYSSNNEDYNVLIIRIKICVEDWQVVIQNKIIKIYIYYYIYIIIIT